MIAKDTIIAVGFPLIAGLFAAFQTSRLKTLQRQTRSWLKTKGFIVESKILGRGKGQSAFVIYEYYTPDTYVGSRICPPGCEDGDPKVYLRRYQVRDEVTVYFDPSAPQQSLLELPSNRAIKAWTIMSAIGFTFPVIYLYWLEYLK